jgi:hypothetical protein
LFDGAVRALADQRRPERMIESVVIAVMSLSDSMPSPALRHPGAHAESNEHSPPAQGALTEINTC